MKITFLGAAEEVTGSKYLIEHENTKVLVDCGLFQGSRELKQYNWKPFPRDASSISALLITHAHIDHIGYIPVLVKQGFKGKIYCSRATYELSAISLVDSGAIQEEDAKKANAYKYSSHVPALPLYTVKEAEYSLKFFHPVEYGHTVQLGDSLSATFISSHHILGAAFIVVSDGKNTLTFSGDLGPADQLIMKAPPFLKHTDYLVLESTYGDRVHEKEGDPLQALGAIVSKTVARGGIVIIPAFAIGRTQSILYSLYRLKQDNVIPDLPIFLDSPMAMSVTDLFCRFQNEHKLSSQLCKDVFDPVIYTRTMEESQRLNNLKKPAIIIVGSGMADGGRVQDHFKYFISDTRNTVIFVGFQAGGTPGRALINGEKELKIHGIVYPVHARIEKINTLSAHADYPGILEWLAHFENKPKKVFITHGERESAHALKEKIEEQFGWSVAVPKYAESFELN